MVKKKILRLLYYFCIRIFYWSTAGENQGSLRLNSIAVEQSDTDKIHLYHYPNPLNASERENPYTMLNSTKEKRLKLSYTEPVDIALKMMVRFELLKVFYAYLRAKESGWEDYNVLCLDYAPLVKLEPNFGDPVPLLRKRYEYVCDIVSEKIVRLILALEANGYVSSLNDIHIVAQSIGAHVSGLIGRNVREQTGRALGRITGLDSADTMILYNNEINLRNQLDLSDATFVDIIHTSTIGFQRNYGHLDVYPDGGLHQRSCLKGTVTNVTELIIGVCSHNIVGKYWEHSIDRPNIIACKDDSWESFQKKKANGCNPDNTLTFGEYVSTNARGKYFLEYPLIEP